LPPLQVIKTLLVDGNVMPP